MPNRDGTTVGIWIGDDEDLLERFDALGEEEGTWSRSGAIKDAMELHLVVEETLADLGYEFDSERSKRHFVRQALRDQARLEAERDRQS